MTAGFAAYPKTPRLDKPIIVTEKIDGTNAQVMVVHQDDVTIEALPYAVAQVGELFVFAGSRKRWVTVGDDNFGFAGWVAANADLLVGLGEGRHYGEWWGRKIQRGYDLAGKRFSLFNVGRWTDVHGTNEGFFGDEREAAPHCCYVVPILAWGFGFDLQVEIGLDALRDGGSIAAPGYPRYEGVVAYHTAARQPYKVVVDKAP